MWEAIIDDPVAVYAAALSTIIALGAVVRILIKWLQSGPRAWVGMLNPKEVAATRYKSTEIIIANTGIEPFVVREIIVTLHRTKRAPSEHSARFFHGTSFDPSMEKIPNPNGKSNSFISVPKIVKPGEEMHHHLQPVSSYDPSQHWLRVQVFIRQKRSPVTGWAAPIKGANLLQNVVPD